MRPSELGTHRLLLGLQDAETLRRFADGVLGPLREYDRRREAQLEDTLRAFLQYDGQFAATAAALYVHVNTLRNRLAKITELTGRDAARTVDRVDLFLALEADELRQRIDRGIHAGNDAGVRRNREQPRPYATSRHRANRTSPPSSAYSTNSRSASSPARPPGQERMHAQVEQALVVPHAVQLRPPQLQHLPRRLDHRPDIGFRQERVLLPVVQRPVHRQLHDVARRGEQVGPVVTHQRRVVEQTVLCDQRRVCRPASHCAAR